MSSGRTETPSLRQYINACRQSGRRIDRQNHIAKDHKVVLFNDFAGAAIHDFAAASPDLVQRRFEALYPVLRMQLEILSTFSQTGVGKLPRRFADAASLETDEAFKPLERQALDMMRAGELPLSFPIEVDTMEALETVQRVITEKAETMQIHDEPMNMLAMNLGTLRAISGLDDEHLQNLKMRSMLGGFAGRDVAGFLERINDLPNYARHFDDRDDMKPPRKGPPTSGDTVKTPNIGKWFPQPAAAPGGA